MDVPMVHISGEDGLELSSLVSDSDLPVYLSLEADAYEWVAFVNSWPWILIIRILVPLGYASVFLLAVAIMSGGYEWGTTKVTAAAMFCIDKCVCSIDSQD